MSTYLELCNKFKKMVGISGTDLGSVVSQSGMNEKITIWIADADELIIRSWHDWKFMLEPKKVISALANTDTYTLSDLSITDLANWKKKTFVANPRTSNYLRLKYDMQYDDYLNSEYYIDAEVTDTVDRVIIRDTDNAVILYPTPSANTTIWAAYYKKATRLSANASESPIPARFEEAIIYRAKMFYAEHLEDTALYNSAQADFTDIMQSLQADQAVGFEGMRTSNDDEHEDIIVY